MDDPLDPLGDARARRRGAPARRPRPDPLRRRSRSRRPPASSSCRARTSSSAAASRPREGLRRLGLRRPEGPRAQHVNCSVADLELTVERPALPARELTLRGRRRLRARHARDRPRHPDPALPRRLSAAGPRRGTPLLADLAGGRPDRDLGRRSALFGLERRLPAGGADGLHPLRRRSRRCSSPGSRSRSRTGPRRAGRGWRRSASPPPSLPRALGSRNGDRRRADETLSVLSSNIHHGNADPAALVALVDRYHPDLLSVEELTPSFARKLTAARHRQPAFPTRCSRSSRSASGAGLYSRLPLRALPAADALLLPDAAGGARDARRAARSASSASTPSRRTPRTTPHLAQGRSTACRRPGAAPPWVLAGDFNATFDQTPVPRPCRARLPRRRRGHRQGPRADLPARGRHLLPPITIDHVLADRRLGHRSKTYRASTGICRARDPTGCRSAPALALPSAPSPVGAAGFAGDDLLEGHPGVVAAERDLELFAA